MGLFHKFIFLLLPLLLAGCAGLSGDIEEGLPKLRDKLPETTKVYLACPLKPNGGRLYSRNGQLVVDEFKAAFTARGISVKVDDRRSGGTTDVLDAAVANGCDLVVFSQVLSWQYGEAGFSGFGGRDEVLLSVMLMRPDTRRVVTRANLRIVNGVGRSPVGGNDDPRGSISPIIFKYVKSLFPEVED